MPSGQCCPTGSTEKDGKCVAPPRSSAPLLELKIAPGGTPSGVTPGGGNPGQNITCLGDAVLVNGVCQIPTNVCAGGAGPDGKCQCSAGATSQPGFQCCPYGTMLNSGGQCQPLCPNGSTAPDDAASCALGVLPNLINGVSYCLDGTTPAVGFCPQQAPLVTGICPAGWTKQPNPQFGGIVMCTPTPQAAACEKQGMEVGTDGTCQTLCGRESQAFPAAQCCPAGQVAAENGKCACPAGDVPGADGKCVTQSKVCPTGEIEIDGKCRREPKIEDKKTNSQMTSPATRCPSNQVAQANGLCGCPIGTFPTGPTGMCCPGDSDVRDGVCVQLVPPCPPGQTVGKNGVCSCPIGTLPTGPTGMCCLGGSAVRDGVCVQLAPPCPPGQTVGKNGVCSCPIGTFPTGPTGMCCLGGSTVRDGVCVQLAPPCPPGQTVGKNGICSCPIGTFPTGPTGKCCPGDSDVRDGVCVQMVPLPQPPSRDKQTNSRTSPQNSSVVQCANGGLVNADGTCPSSVPPLCSAGATPQPGFQCCPYNTLPGCRSPCPGVRPIHKA